VRAVRRRIPELFVAAILTLVLAAPASAGPPDRFEEPFTANFPDTQLGLVVFVNTDRAAYCTDDVVDWEEAVFAWLLGGAQGDPPEDPEFPSGFDGVSIQEHETRSGAVIYQAKGSDLTIELWQMDADAPLIGPCTDTDDAMHRVARGSASFIGNDNDLFGSGTRGNAFGDRGRADLTDDAGNAWHYSWLFHINSRCYTPEDGAPRCLLERSALQAR
jgi:hypothetical protein